MQTAESLVTSSEMAISAGMGPKGSALKVMSRPAMRMRLPRWTSSTMRGMMLVSKNWASSIPMTSMSCN